MEHDVIENHTSFQTRGKQFLNFLEDIHIKRNDKEKWKGFVKGTHFFNQLHKTNTYHITNINLLEKDKNITLN